MQRFHADVNRVCFCRSQTACFSFSIGINYIFKIEHEINAISLHFGVICVKNVYLSTVKSKF